MNDPHALARVWRSEVVCNVTVHRVLLTSHSVVLCYCAASLRNANKSERMLAFTPRSPRPSPPSHPPPRCSWSAAVLGAYLPLHERKARLKHAFQESGSRWRHFSLYNSWWLKLTEKLSRIDSCVFGERLRNEESGGGLFLSLWRAQWEAGAWTPADGCHYKQASSQVLCSPPGQ